MKRAKVLSCLHELTNKLSMLSSVMIGRKMNKNQKVKEPLSYSWDIIHPFISSDLQIRSSLGSQALHFTALRTSSGSAAVCMLHTLVLEGRSETQSQGGPQLFARRASVGRADELL